MRVFHSHQKSMPLAEALGFTDDDITRIAALAEALVQEGRDESALRILGGLVSLQPERAEFWSALGVVLTRLQRYGEALPVLTLALRMRSDDRTARVYRSECYIAMGNPEAAAKDLAAVLEADPEGRDPATHRAQQLASGLFEFFAQVRREGLDRVSVDDEAAVTPQ